MNLIDVMSVVTAAVAAVAAIAACRYCYYSRGERKSQALDDSKQKEWVGGKRPCEKQRSVRRGETGTGKELGVRLQTKTQPDHEWMEWKNEWDGWVGKKENATEPCVQRRHAMKIAYDVQRPSSLTAPLLPRASSRPIMR
jgi:hypothetical protein